MISAQKWLSAVVSLTCLFGASAARARFEGAADQKTQANNHSNLMLRPIGPAVFGGRIDSIAVSPENSSTFYVGTATGGLWKTINDGATFASVFDDEPVLTIGDVAVAPSDPAIVWVGTGEANNRQTSSWGNGVYKSTDSGHSWQHLGLDDTQSIGRIVIDPSNPDIVYVAALGHLFGPNSERGLFKTTDGGKNWSKLLFIDNDTGVVDVAIDPQSHNILYACAYERRRTPWGFDGGGPGSGIYKSTDSGSTWKKLASGLPTDSNMGRIGIAVYRRNPEIVYAIVEDRAGGVFRSEDRGETWRKMGSGMASPYFSQIQIDPNNDLRVWVLLDNAYYSADGGKSFVPELTENVHSDFHALWIDPADSRHMIAGTDGGVWLSNDRGRAWNFVNVLPVAQAYHVGYDEGDPYQVCAGFQDNGSWCAPSRTRSAEGLANTDWRRIITGDGFYAVPDPSDPNSVYSDAQEGQLVRLNWKTHEWTPIMPLPRLGESAYRYGWDSPFLVSSHDPKTIYLGANVLLKSQDRGASWTPVSGDLTTGADRNKLPILGRLPTEHTVALNYGVTWYPCLSAVAESPLDANILWVGTQDGNLQVTRDGGKNWTNVAERVNGVPKGTWVSSIVASHTGAGTAYVTFDGHRSDDFHDYVYRTRDFGHSWQAIAAGLPDAGETAKVIREDAQHPDVLLLGTERGAFTSHDTGGHWQPLGLGLPKVPVDDIAFQDKKQDLIVATHGRGLWILDDARPITTWNAGQSSEPFHVFPIREATEWREYIESNGFQGNAGWFAHNPQAGALITYYLKEKPVEEKKPEVKEKEETAQSAESPAAQSVAPKPITVKVVVRSSDGQIVRELEGPAEAGLNRTNWDLRYATPAKPADIQVWGMQQGFFIYRVLPNLGMPAPFVAPGKYTVELSLQKLHASEEVEVREDPSIAISAPDLEAHRKLMMDAFHLYGSAVDTQKKLMGVETALTAAINSWKKTESPAVPQDVQKAAGDLSKAATELHTQLISPKRGELPSMNPPSPLMPLIARLLYSLESDTVRPTPLQEEEFTQYRDSLEKISAKVETLAKDQLSSLNKKIYAAGVPYIRVLPEAPPPGEP